MRFYDPELGRFINSDDENVPAATPSQAHWDKNLFAYCDNNPNVRADDGGQFWHVLIAGAVSGLISGIADAVTQYVTTGEVDWKQTAIAAGAGAVSGMLSMIPGSQLLTTGISIASNSLLSVGSYAATEAVNGREITTKGVFINAVSGAVGGAVGSAFRGKSTSALGKRAKTTVKQGTRRVTNGVANSVKSTIKSGFRRWDQGLSMLNRYGWQMGVNSGVGSCAGLGVNQFLSWRILYV